MRIIIKEYSGGINLRNISSDTDELNRIKNAIWQKNEELKQSLQSKYDSLQIHSDVLVVSRIAGIIQLSKDLELEIVPKIVNDLHDHSWRTTFYYLSLVSPQGILSEQNIQSNISYLDAFYDISGRLLAESYLENQRKPIRKYQKKYFKDFFISGEIDFDSFSFIEEGGYRQEENKFEIHNEYNSTIVQAMRFVYPYLHDLKYKIVLKRAIDSYGSSSDYSKIKLNVPCRNKEWKMAYDLSYNIIQGFTCNLDEGSFFSHGFVFNTWQLWEWLISIGISTASKDYVVKLQESTKWGIKNRCGQRTIVTVNPDVSLYYKKSNQHPFLLIDAKYKNYDSEINRDDLNEAFNFCIGTGCNSIVLVYPNDLTNVAPGNVIHDCTYELGVVKVYSILVSLGNINSNEGLYEFGSNLLNGILSLNTEF